MRLISQRLAGAAGLAALLFTLAATPAISSAAPTRLSPETQDDSRHTPQAPDLYGCDNLRVPAGNELAFSLYAEGVQVYKWDGAQWVFVAPKAFLYSNLGPAENGTPGPVLGTHFAGPTWESLTGSRVVGSVVDRCTPTLVDGAIPWLLLEAVDHTGYGIFDNVTYIQRLHTNGGLAPSTPGAVAGQKVYVPYSAYYYFYRSSK